MWFAFIQKIFEIISKGGVIFEWLTKPIISGYEEIPLIFMLLDRIGVDISWIYNLSPLGIFVDSMIAVLTFFLIMRLIHAVKALWPLGG